jgi:heme-degrading monooxygenase HmoA
VIVSIVRFRSRLPDGAVPARFQQRVERYQEVPGLIEKIYLRFRDTGEWGAVYVWESEESLAEFRTSELAQSIPSTYEVEGDARTELADVMLVVQRATAAAT